MAAQTAGPASLLAWIAMIVLSAPLALTYAALSRARPDAGGFTVPLELAFGPRLSGITGWLLLAQVPTGLVVVTLVAGQYAAAAVGQRWLVPAGIFLVACALGLNLVGLRLSANVQLAALTIIALAVTVVASGALVHTRIGAFRPFFPLGILPIGLAAAQLFWAFVGWEAITPLASEFRNPSDIWRATVITLGLVGFLYLVLAIATIGTHAYAGGPTGQADVARMAVAVFGPLAGPFVGLGGFLLAFPMINAFMAGLSRLAASLACRGHLPQWLGSMSDAVPRRALLALSVTYGLSIAALLPVHLDIARLLPLSAANFIVIYIISMAAAARLLSGVYRYLAAIALVCCTAVLAFLGPVLLWPVVVASAALLYQRLASRPAIRIG